MKKLRIASNSIIIVRVECRCEKNTSRHFFENMLYMLQKIEIFKISRKIVLSN